jgi:hypothetical protein
MRLISGANLFFDNNLVGTGFRAAPPVLAGGRQLAQESLSDLAFKLAATRGHGLSLRYGKFSSI